MSAARGHPLATELCLLSLQGLAGAQGRLVLEVSWVCGCMGADSGVWGWVWGEGETPL